MKKLISLFLLLTMLLLTGCGDNDGADYSGSYALLTKEGYTYLVIHWEYPEDKQDDFDIDTAEFDLTNLESYIDPNMEHKGPGLILNSLLGNLGYNKAYMAIRTIKIDAEEVPSLTRKGIKIYMTIQDKAGTEYTVRLKYNKDIKE